MTRGDIPAKSRVTLIVVNWNGRRFLERLLNSLKSQTYKNLEIIMVDNSSSDDSVDFVKKSFPEITLLSSENLGFGHSCNLAVEKSTGEYLAFLNEDMYLPKDFVENMMSFYIQQSRKFKNVGAVGCRIADFDTDPTLTPVTYGGRIDLFGYPISKFDKEDLFGISGSPLFMAKRTYVDIGRFCPDIFLYGEDIDICWRLRLFGYKLLINPDAYLHHFGGGVSGGFKPKKVALLLASNIVPILNCYSTPLLLVVLPMYTVYILSVLAFLTFRNGFDKAIAKEYFKCVKNVFVKLPSILSYRKFVQGGRKMSEKEMFKYISFVPSIIYNQWWKKLAKVDE